MAEANAAPQGGAQAYYHDQLAKGQFVIQCCQECDRAVFYPRMICPHCGSGSLDWIAPSGRGTVYSTTVVRRKAEQGGDYNVALIDLQENVRMMSRVEGVPPADVHIGMAVRARVAQTEQGNLVVFDHAPSASPGLQAEGKRGNIHTALKAPPYGGGEGPAQGSGLLHKEPA